jgi:hypothetical protein
MRVGLLYYIEVLFSKLNFVFMNKRDNKNMLQFITGNVSDDLRYDIEPLFYKAYAKALTSATGAHFSASHYEIASHYFNKFKVDTNKDVNEVAAEFKAFVENRKVEYADFLTYAAQKSIFTSGYFRRNGSPETFRYSGRYNYELIDFLLHLTGNKKDYDSYTECHAYMDQNGIGQSEQIKNKEIHGLKVNAFQNGRLDIKGLTQKQQKEIDKLISLHEKLKGM